VVNGGVLNRASDSQLRKPYADIANPDQASSFTRTLRRRKNDYLVLTAVNLYERVVVPHTFRHDVMLLKNIETMFQ